MVSIFSHILRRHSAAYCCLAILFIMASQLQAQLVVRLQMNKSSYLLNEPVTAIVQITNNAGRDLKLRGTPGRPWLAFNISARGTTMPSVGRVDIQPLVVPRGQTVSTKVVLSTQYALGSRGNYTAEASVSMGSSGLFIASNRSHFSVSGGIVLWRQRAGVPGSSEEVREYKLTRFTGDGSVELFAEVNSANRGVHYATIPLGKVLSSHTPLASLDEKNQLHILYQVSPVIFVHTVISLQGDVVSAGYIKKSTDSPPRLIRQGNGTVYVSGGVDYDPTVTAKKRNKVRKSSDRPSSVYR